MSNFFTRASHARLLEELTKLRAELLALSRAKGAAAAEGDLSENAEYHATSEKLTVVQRRIYEIEEQLRSPRFVEELAISCMRVSIGTKVRCLDLQLARRSRLHYPGTGRCRSRTEHYFVSIATRPGAHQQRAGRRGHHHYTGWATAFSHPGYPALRSLGPR